MTDRAIAAAAATSSFKPRREGIASLQVSDVLERRYALRVAARLTERSNELPHHVGERLRAGREQALERARHLRKAVSIRPVSVTPSGVATLGRGGWWPKVASVVPVIALIGGLLLIQQWQTNTQISVAAEVDAALLADDLPPKAYSDPGFLEFLKTPRE